MFWMSVAIVLYFLGVLRVYYSESMDVYGWDTMSLVDLVFWPVITFIVICVVIYQFWFGDRNG